jgi:hypothetical protein
VNESINSDTGDLLEKQLTARLVENDAENLTGKTAEALAEEIQQTEDFLFANDGLYAKDMETVEQVLIDSNILDPNQIADSTKDGLQSESDELAEDYDLSVSAAELLEAANILDAQVSQASSAWLDEEIQPQVLEVIEFKKAEAANTQFGDEILDAWSLA